VTASDHFTSWLKLPRQIVRPLSPVNTNASGGIADVAVYVLFQHWQGRLGQGGP
jgi:hypothetical protein